MLPDVNVLIAARRADHPHHQVAYAFMQTARQDGTALTYPDFVLASVLRLLTHPRIFRDPESIDDATAYVDALLAGVSAAAPVSGAASWPQFIGLARTMQLAANMLPDAFLAAVAIDHRTHVVTFDRGFKRYPGLLVKLLRPRAGVKRNT